tara:strand:+ start:796 stop:1797 length:1002 start_codon:yes stop_codon:yes gene_type:complete
MLIKSVKRLFFLFFFLFLINNLQAKEKYIYGEPHNVGNSSCFGYCEDKEQIIQIREVLNKNKEFDLHYWSIINSVNIEDTFCTIFSSFENNLEPSYLKKGNKNSHLKIVGSKLLSKEYYINMCVPCPPDLNIFKENKSGFCSIPIFSYIIFFKNILKYPIDHYSKIIKSNDEIISKLGDLYTNLGRDEKNFSDRNIVGSVNEIHSEAILLSISSKETIIFINQKFKSKTDFFESNDWYYNYIKFKTSAKIQPVSYSTSIPIRDENIINFIKKFKFKIQKNFFETFNLNGPKFKNIKSLYNTIPTLDELKNFDNEVKKYQNLKKFYEFHIQTRN